LDGFPNCPGGPKNAGFWGRFLTPFFGLVLGMDAGAEIYQAMQASMKRVHALPDSAFSISEFRQLDDGALYVKWKEFTPEAGITEHNKQVEAAIKGLGLS
jgi:hypothetical protein